MNQIPRRERLYWSWGGVVALSAVVLGSWWWQPVANADSKAPPSVRDAMDLAATTKRPVPKARKAAPAKAKPASAPAKSAATAPAKPAATAPAKPAAKPSPSNILAALYVASPEKVLDRGLQIVEMIASKELKQASDEVIRRGLGMVLPQLKQVKLHRAVKLLPSMVRPLGVDLSKPAGFLLARAPASMNPRWRRPKFVPIVALSVDRVRLMATLQLLGFSPRLRTEQGLTFLTIGQGGKGSSLGVLVGEQLYITARAGNHPVVGVNTDAHIRAVLAQIARQKQPFQRAFADGGLPHIWKKLQSGDLSIAVIAPKIGRLFGMVPANPALAFLRSVGLSLKLSKHHYESRFFVKANPMLAPVFAPFAPGPKAKQSFALLPHQVALFAQAHVDIKKLLALPQLLVSRRILPPQFGMIAQMQLMRVQGELKKRGFDLNKFASLLSGQFLTGLAWDDTLRAHLGYGSPRALFRGHLHGVFGMLGLRSAAAGPQMFQMLKGTIAQLYKTSRSFKGKLTAKDVELQGLKALEVTLKGVAPMFFINKGDMVAFAGSKRTADLIAAVWQGAAPSLAQHLKRHPNQAVVFGNAKGNVAAYLPHVVRQILVDRNLFQLRSRVPKQARAIFEVLKMAKAVRFQTLIGDAQLESISTFAVRKKPWTLPARYSGPKSTLPTQGTAMSMVAIAAIAPLWPLAGLPVGVLASVAIPAFLRFSRKSKTSEVMLNIKAIADGAIAWFDAEHSDRNGDPLAKHFPHKGSPTKATSGRSVSTWPKTAPCANGKAKYPKNPSGWNKEPWRSLKFGIYKPHYYQYTFITEGTGSKAKFTIIARGDLDCDGKYSTYKLTGKVNPATGEVERSAVIVKDSLE